MASKKRIIRNVNELPEWYDLGKYEAASSLDAASWYELVLQRWNHFYWFDFHGAEKYKRAYPNGENPFYAALLQLRENPLSLLVDDTQIHLIGGGQLDALKYDKDYFSTFSYAIKPLTIRRMYQNENRLKRSVIVRIRKWADQLFGDFLNIEMTDEYKAECKWALSFIDDPIFEAFEKQGEEQEPYGFDVWRSRDFVEIDLSVPDKILIQQFNDYLRHVRKKYPYIKKAPKFKYPEYQKWIDYGVLPYLDLKLWANEEGVSIPYRVMTDAIFSNGDKGEEMVRKTTTKIADMLMKKEYNDFLATIAAHEIAEKN
jgi:hypothetical protein